MSRRGKKQSKIKGVNAFNKTQSELKKRIPYIKLLYVSFAANLLVLVFLFFFRENIPPEVPLYYGFPEGEDQLAQKAGLIIPSLISIISLIINSSLAYFTKDDFIKKTFIIAGFAITFLSIVTTLKISFLVGSY